MTFASPTPPTAASPPPCYAVRDAAPILDFAAAEAVLFDRNSDAAQLREAVVILAQSADREHRMLASNMAMRLDYAELAEAERKPIPVIDFATPVFQRRAQIEAGGVDWHAILQVFVVIWLAGMGSASLWAMMRLAGVL